MDIAISHLAALARLALNEEEKERLETDLSGILAYVDQLREVDTEGAAEITQAAPELNVVRADELLKNGGEETVALMRNMFSESEDGYVRVPPVIKK